MSALRALWFDADGVLQETPRAAFSLIAALVGPEESEDTWRFFREIREAEKPTLSGKSDFVTALAPVLRRWHVSAAPTDVAAYWDDIEVDQEMYAAVQELRENGLLTCLTTNQHPERAAHMRRALGYDLIFDAHFYSCEVGLAKPDPAYYRHILTELDLDPSEVLYVDDNADNVAAARDLGVHAEQFEAAGGRPELERILAEHGLRLSLPGRI